MKHLSLILVEIALLFSALFFTLPYVPSHEMERIPLFPTAAFAVVLFAASRCIRWRSNVLIPIGETAGFALFAWGSNQAVNLIFLT